MADRTEIASGKLVIYRCSRIPGHRRLHVLTSSKES
jgi:hypothetical protein